MEGLAVLWILGLGVIVVLKRRQVEMLLLTAWCAMGLAALFEVYRLIAYWLS